MDWIEICISVATHDTESAEAICNMAASQGLYIEDYSDLEQGAEEIAHINLIDEQLIAKDRTVSIIHLYISTEYNFNEYLQFISERLTAAGIGFSVKTNTLRDSDWADNWKKFFKVTDIGEKLVICPSWESCKKTDKVVLKIDPGAAFGTGTHATTSLCLELLQKYAGEGRSVLDIGCGSGILSIAAVLLGAEKADGVDIDATAVKVAKENAALNNVEKKTNFIVGDLAEKINGKYDVVCANIVADIIIRLTDNVIDFMNPDAVFIISGIIDVRADDVIDAFTNVGFTAIDTYRRDNWYAFALKYSREVGLC